jgi:hypothetical protein
MSFDKIQLPDFLIADLYKDCLVELESIKEEKEAKYEEKIIRKPEPQPEASKTIKYLGQNQKKITVIVDTPEAAIIGDTDLTFLSNILKACGFNLGDIAIVNKSNQEIQFQTIREQLSANYILLFNVDPMAIGLPFTVPNFQVQPYADSTIMTAPSLSVLNQPTEESRLLKTKLWTSLKRVFNLG